MANKFKDDDRVILTDKGLIPFPDWPVWGSEYECVGTIIETRHGFIHVLWDNGYSKITLPKSLSHFNGREENTLSPNVAFMLYKRSKDAKGR